MEIAFAMHLAQRLNVSSEGSRLAVIQFAETPRIEFTLNQYTHPTQLEWAIQRINFLSGATNTGLALKLALERGFDGARGGEIPRVAVVVTDGQSQVVAILIFFSITGNPVRVFTVESFDQLDKSLADSLTWDMCKTEFREFFFAAPHLQRRMNALVLAGPGTPDIICGPDRIGVRASTKKPFDGYVFVMDHFHEEECRAGAEKFPDSKSIGITVPFNACNVHRYRSLNPRGIFVEMTVVFMFHSM
ncbi:von Willebrand factor type A domain protein [Oesophagostomum dentatum]|uniref:von Willebrand factor type A domain protein n=1 Tax=Oesophagostomum dentatum TaxID=61180 RepID=A0A0B1T6Q3_OESDE|nr:von Willebrand factor type A domain protein [Oesophagostomum dentatum]